MTHGERTLGYSVSILGGGGAAALFFTDLTDALADERRAAEAQRFAEVGRIARAMAHELKTPLATVELYATLLRRALAEGDPGVKHLDVIGSQTRLCLERLQAILHSINPDAARAAGMTLTPVSPLVRAAVADQRRRNDGARLSLRVTANGARVGLAESDLRSVVTNLVINALEVTAGKGPVDVRVDDDGDRVRLRVADRGPGLPDADVFAAFFTTKASGTGLGLWLVRRLVEDAGGEHLGPLAAWRRRAVRSRPAGTAARAAGAARTCSSSRTTRPSAAPSWPRSRTAAPGSRPCAARMLWLGRRGAGIAPSSTITCPA